jgi:APA family basic amino acid/polyamine antiporter
LVALVIAALILPHAASSEPAPAIAHGWPLLVAIGVAMQGVIYTYDSYYAVVYTGEEMMDPGKEIPRSIFRGLGLITAIYLLLNLTFVAVVPMGRMAHNPFVGGLLAEALFGAAGDRIVRAIMVVAIVSTLNAQLIAAPRILLAMARDGLFPPAATRVNEGGTPAVALALSVAAVIAFLVMGSPAAAFELDSIFIAVGYVVTFVAFFVLRRKEPDAPRPYRARGYPWVQAAALIIILGFLGTVAVGNVRDVLITLAVLAVSWPLSKLVRRRTATA